MHPVRFYYKNTPQGNIRTAQFSSCIKAPPATWQRSKSSSLYHFNCKTRCGEVLLFGDEYQKTDSRQQQQQRHCPQ